MENFGVGDETTRFGKKKIMLLNTSYFYDLNHPDEKKRYEQ